MTIISPGTCGDLPPRTWKYRMAKSLIPALECCHMNCDVRQRWANSICKEPERGYFGFVYYEISVTTINYTVIV